jgi:hypothetical protein
MTVMMPAVMMMMMPVCMRWHVYANADRYLRWRCTCHFLRSERSGSKRQCAENDEFDY